MTVLVRRPFSTDDLVGLVTSRPLSAEQSAVVTAPLEAGVVVAGAGSGKTTTMVARVAYLVATGQVAADAVLGLTFTTKAADELAGRIRTAFRGLRAAGWLSADPFAAGTDPDDGPAEPTVSTYHAYAARLVRDHALRVGREPAARLITPATSWQLAARVVGTYDGDLSAVDLTQATVVRRVLALAGDLSEHLRGPEHVLAFGEQLRAVLAATTKATKRAEAVLEVQRAREQLLPLVAAYDRAKRDQDLLDFGDVVRLAAQLATACPEVAAAERLAFPVVLLDEYQDTGSAQEQLLAGLFGDGHAVTAVGDPCQSIYGWRGASAGTLRRFPQRFGAAAGSTRHLSTNYRSGGRLLELANVVSADLRSGSVRVPELAPRPGAEVAGQLTCALLGDVGAEAGWVAEQVVATLRAGQLPWSEAAVLCRKRAMFPLLRQAFESLDVPVEVVGLGGLLEVPEVADIVATLRVLDDPTADAALLRLLTGPRWRLGPRDMVALGRRARSLAHRGQRPEDPLQQVVLGVEAGQDGSLVDALDDLPDTGLSVVGRERLIRLRDELRALRRRLGQPLPDLVADVERTLCLDVEVVVRSAALEPSAARADLDAFADAASDFAGDVAQDGSGQVVLSAFLAFLDAAEDEEHGLDAGAVSASNTVKLMTVHAAKGLEWPVVAVPGLAAGQRSACFPGRPKGTSWLKQLQLLPFPLRGDAGDLPELHGLAKPELDAFEDRLADRDAAEERRLGYVAFTRAEHVLLCSGYHWGEGSLPLGPSVFLEEVRALCLQGAGSVDRWDEPPPDNPLTVTARTAAWPVRAVPAAAGVVRAAARVRALVANAPSAEVPQLVLSKEQDLIVASWDADLERLSEEDRRRRSYRSQAVLPRQLSVSALVELRRDPDALARSLLRPMPRQPSPLARRGTAFHAWLEREVFGNPQLLGPDELPGSADEAAADERLDELKARFQRSAWHRREPLAIEVPFEMPVGGVTVRGRMDAVFRDGDRDEVVDWKTGAVPTGAAAQAAAVQLAAYRLAWAALAGVPPEQVSAAFHYVRAGVTHRPVDLLDEAGLRALVSALPVEGS